MTGESAPGAVEGGGPPAEAGGGAGAAPVLVAEDDPNDAMLLQRALKKAGIKSPLVIVADGDEAVAYLSRTGRYSDRKEHALPAAVILDLGLPKRSGLEVLNFIRTREELRSLVVVVLSNSDAPIDIQRAHEYGANAYWVKPISAINIPEIVRAIEFSSRRGDPLRVLVVDDNPDDRVLIGRQLQLFFSSVTLLHAASEQELERHLAAGAFDLMVTDYALRWTNGLVVLHACKQRWPDIPVIMFTGTGNEEIAVEAMKVGLDDYVLKSGRRVARLPLAALIALDRARQREKIKATEERYQSLFEGVPVGLFRLGPSGRVLEANPAMALMLGHEDPAGIREAHSQAFVLDESARARFLEQLGGARAVSNFEVELKDKAGRSVWAEVNARAVRGPHGEVASVEGSAQDITRRRVAQNALRESEERYRTIVETAHEGIWMVDAQNRTTFTNARVSEMTGYLAEEMRGRTFFEFLGKESQELALSALEDLEPQKSVQGEFRIVGKGGRDVWVLASANPLHGPDGAYIGALSMMIDVTKERAARQVRDEILDVISHEFRTPVTVIQGYAQLIAGGDWKPGDKVVEDARRRIEGATQHLAFLLNSIMELAVLRSGGAVVRKEAVSTKELVDESFKILEWRGREKAHSVELRIGPGADTFHADRRKVTLALSEVLDNARKFSPPGSPLLIEATAGPEGLALAVHDRGGGFPDAVMARPFELFSQGDRSSSRTAGGAGLGLALVDGLMRVQGGHAEVERRTGGGSTVRLVLPGASSRKPAERIAA